MKTMEKTTKNPKNHIQTNIPHKSVLTREVLKYLGPQPAKVYLDATFGCGGHTRAILEATPDCRVIALDWDKNALEEYATPLKEEFGDRLVVIWGNFGNLYRILKKKNISYIDGIIADFGTSQYQIKERDGFSLYNDTPLDMRMSPAHTYLKASDIINKFSDKQLLKIFSEYGEEHHAKKIATAIVSKRKKKKFETTTELAQFIEKISRSYSSSFDKLRMSGFARMRGSKQAGCKQRKKKIHPATKVFQALRIFINKELQNIKQFLAAAFATLTPEGRFVCISFHSLEDRLIKQFFQKNAPSLEIMTKKPITPSDEEKTHNPSSRSAKLRAAQKAPLCKNTQREALS